jgi:pSer/pThr/pTyr-binding forkhead associated (FHA) protein
MAFLQVYCNGELKFKSPLNPGTTCIGRTADNDVVIDNAGVSAHHAFIMQDGDVFVIEDANSTNGVFVNGQRVTRKQLQFGDEITIFKHILKFTAVDVSPTPSGAVATAINPAITQDRTVMVKTAQLLEIMKERQAHSAYLLYANGAKRGQKFILSKPRCTIGKSADCDIRAGGWFAPKLAAKILRQSSGYFIFPERWGKIRVNGAAVTTPVKLQQGDSVEVRGVELAFYETATARRST